MKILVIGHSHVDCVSAAWRALAPEFARRGLAITTLQMRDERFHTDPSNDDAGVGERLRDSIALQARGCDASVMMLGGIAQNSFGLFEHPQPLDFVLDEEPGLAVDPERQLVPSALLAGHLARSPFFAGPAAQRRRLLPLLPPVLGQTDAPPPIADTAALQALLLDAQRRSERARHGMAPALLRYKAWRLHGRLLAQDCRAAGLPFLPVPAAVQDPRGFLVPEAWGADAIHANAWYGRQLIEQMLALAEARHRHALAA